MDSSKSEMKKDSFSQEEKERLSKYFPHVKLARLVPGDFVVPETLDIDAIKNFGVYEDDVWIVTPPKCGTTWMQELTWLILNDVDLKKAEINQFFRFPFLELCYVKPLAELDPKNIPLRTEYPGPDVPLNEDTLRWFMRHSMEYSRRMTRPRNIKTHLPISALPSDVANKCKLIYVGRNIKDACVSWYHHMTMDGFNGGFKDLAKLFRENRTMYNPLIPHVLEGWNLKDRPNIFFTTYEEMSIDLRGVASRLIKFLGKDESKIDMEKLLNAVHIDSFRKNPYVNKEREVIPDGKGAAFIRKGKIGDWKNHFDEEMNQQWDPWIEDQLKGSDFKMIFE